MSRSIKTVVILSSLIVLGYVGLGLVLAQTKSNDSSYRALAVYSEVLQRVQQDYVEDPNMPLVTSGALHGLLESLDPRSSYLSAREYAEYKRKVQANAKGDTGAVLSKRFGYVAVVSVLHDSPAYKAGLRSGDLLEGIAGFTTREMSIGQAEFLLAGEPGSAVKVSVISRRSAAGQSEELDIVRREIVYPRVHAEKLENDIAYIRLAALNVGKAAELSQKLQQFEKAGLRRLVLDLRECAAGDVNEGIEAARLFVPSGTLVSLRGQTVSEKKFATDPGKVVWKHPMVVLISNGTSGAGEILAAALISNPSASGTKVELVGERTFGTASEQKLIPLEDGSALILTVANYYTAAGKAIAESGVEPTVEVASSTDLADLDETPAAQGAKGETGTGDAALKRAIEVLLNPASAEKKGQARLSRPRNYDLAS